MELMGESFLEDHCQVDLNVPRQITSFVSSMFRKCMNKPTLNIYCISYNVYSTSSSSCLEFYHTWVKRIFHTEKGSKIALNGIFLHPQHGWIIHLLPGVNHAVAGLAWKVASDFLPSVDPKIKAGNTTNPFRGEITPRKPIDVRV